MKERYLNTNEIAEEELKPKELNEATSQKVEENSGLIGIQIYPKNKDNESTLRAKRIY
jgi:hypothetical protein